MIPDYNRDGKIDKYDKEMEEIFLQEDEHIRDEYLKQGRNAEGWAVIVVIAVMVVLGFLLLH